MDSKLSPHYFYTEDGTRIFYKCNFDTAGTPPDSPVWVFNYGLVCNMAHWEHQLNHFAQQGVPILIHDYRAHYNSSGQCDIASCTFANIYQDLQQLLSSLGVKKVMMLGHSMGVNITLEYAFRHPDQLVGVVLISGSVFPPQDIMFDSNIIDLVEPYISWVATNFNRPYEHFWSKLFMLPFARSIVHSGGFNTEQVPQEFVHTYLKKLGQLPHQIFWKHLEEMRNHDIINHLESIKTPALIMGGDRDKIIPNYLQQILSKYLVNSQLYIIKDGSHVPQVDFPDTVNQRIDRFAQSLV
ncbi:MAG: alpha/beta hydrolase [Bdellovibrionales bacterium]|jgi:non-heme chloroperoxidase|nr:alpha/beta hydrolase [Bdellovibrionales bacterium]MBT3527069.1 alpha/beta hydrolase [Bdellovibrionales bacterium]MBT7766455.1 alpha/beta hydrolase [Bdellovibrionales bacterium]